MPPRPHPKPEPATPASLNHAVRQELWYIDTMVAAPFRMLRRMARGPGMSAGKARDADHPLGPSMPGMSVTALREGIDEVLWAAEGMSRLPVKLLQAAFGEQRKPPSGPDPGGGGGSPGRDA